MSGWFLDSSVLLLAVGGPHPMREPCRSFLARAAERAERIHLSVEGGQEYLFHRMRRVSRERAIAEFDQLDQTVVWHDFSADILRAARDLVARGHARGRDAVHVATAWAAGFTAIVSSDVDFDGIPGLERITPH
ncbi:type II toxin-antitoxin system VapC family toxin [Blastococcus sp. Marseille-P5729]|uniref:type II toxin-antitoxin system VapC family toxin n=1 Tax=Blastococcus sp. Marseille-P5729 TaxID=2086582 RepID=UPI000D113B0B|nr:type II toxin-antitoxin system VapC family toxin [Blastococcus sp. Marseille-P5729]